MIRHSMTPVKLHIKSSQIFNQISQICNAFFANLHKWLDYTMYTHKLAKPHNYVSPSEGDGGDMLFY